MNAQNERKIPDCEHVLIEYILFILHALPGSAVVACAELTINHCIIVEKKNIGRRRMIMRRIVNQHLKNDNQKESDASVVFMLH